MSNYPPGVTTDMIPGWCPEDIAWNRWSETIDPLDIAEALLSPFNMESELRVRLVEAIEAVLAYSNLTCVGYLGSQLGCNDTFESYCSGEADYYEKDKCFD